MMHLIELYFSKVNLFWPLLHRPTFEKAVTGEMHLHDDDFASVLLLVCAVASRFSDDPRILLDGSEDLTSAGWRWYQQVQLVKRSVIAPPSLCDLQYYCVSAFHLSNLSLLEIYRCVSSCQLCFCKGLVHRNSAGRWLA